MMTRKSGQRLLPLNWLACLVASMLAHPAFEAPGALTPGGDGLEALRTIFSGPPARLVAEGTLLVEHSYDQRDAVAQLFESTHFTRLIAARDVAGHRRVAGREVEVGTHAVQVQ